MLQPVTSEQMTALLNAEEVQVPCPLAFPIDGDCFTVTHADQSLCVYILGTNPCIVIAKDALV